MLVGEEITKRERCKSKPDTLGCPEPDRLALDREEMLGEDKVQLVKVVERYSNTGLVLCGLPLTSGMQG